MTDYSGCHFANQGRYEQNVKPYKTEKFVIEMFYLNSTFLEYYKLDRLLTGLTAKEQLLDGIQIKHLYKMEFHHFLGHTYKKIYFHISEVILHFMNTYMYVVDIQNQPKRKNTCAL